MPIKLSGKIAGGPDQTTKLGIEADLTSVKLDNILPGWVKLPGKSGKADFKVVPKAQSTRLEDIVIDGGGASIKGSLEVDPERRPHERELPDLLAVRRRQDLAEGGARPGRRGQGARCAATCSTAAAS